MFCNWSKALALFWRLHLCGRPLGFEILPIYNKLLVTAVFFFLLLLSFVEMWISKIFVVRTNQSVAAHYPYAKANYLCKGFNPTPIFSRVSDHITIRVNYSLSRTEFHGPFCQFYPQILLQKTYAKQTPAFHRN
jgi:hypothetical protein